MNPVGSNPNTTDYPHFMGAPIPEPLNGSRNISERNQDQINEQDSLHKLLEKATKELDELLKNLSPSDRFFAASVEAAEAANAAEAAKAVETTKAIEAAKALEAANAE